jgi:hypothetical protein
LCKWFTATCSKEKPVTWPMIIDEVTIADKDTFSECTNKQLLVYTLVRVGRVA